MSGLELLAPLGLAALIGLPLVILFHMRHTTPLVRPVPTLRFWLAAIDQHSEQTRFRRPPLSLLLLLHLVIVALLALALSRPVTTEALGGLGRRTEPKHVILLLDGSTSMAATDTPSGQSRFEEARDRALARVADLREGDVATLVLLGTRTLTFEATDAAGMKALRDRLSRIDPPGGRADLNAALRLAKDLLLPQLEDQVVLVSDGALAVDPSVVGAVGAPIEFVRVGRATTPNVAIADLSARASLERPGEQQLYARVANFGGDRVSGHLVVRADGIEVLRQHITLEPDGDAEQLVRGVPAGAERVTVEFEVNDALPDDNVASLVLTRDANLGLRILLVSDYPTYLQRALSVLPGALLTTESTTESLTVPGDRGQFDLVVFEGFVPPDGAFPDAPVVLVGPPRESLLPTRGMMTAPSVVRVRALDSMLNGVELAGVTFGETPIHVLDATQTEIVGADAGPLIYRGTVTMTGQPMIVLTFDVNQSNLPQRVAFPILIANIANELAPSPLPSAVPLGDPLRYQPRADAATVRIMPPAGDAVDLSVATGAEVVDGDDRLSTMGTDRLREVVYADTGRSGEYQIVELDAGGEELGGGTFIVNAGHSRESDLRLNPDLAGILATAQATEEEGVGRTLADLWPALVTAALIVLGLEWLWSVLPRRRRSACAWRPTSGQSV